MLTNSRSLLNGFAFGIGAALFGVAAASAQTPLPTGNNPAQAREMIASTMAGKLLGGYRGSQKLDEGAVVDALVSLSKLAARLGDRLESIEIGRAHV